MNPWADALAMYEAHLLSMPELGTYLHNISGKPLGCHCDPAQ